MTKEGKTVRESAVDSHTYKIFPNDLNSQGTVFGGLVVSICDRIALVVAERHSGRICVTAAIDSVHFLAPAKHGDNLIFRAACNRAWRSSMEIGVQVKAEDYRSSDQVHILSAYFTFVALDDQRCPIAVPPIIPETANEQRRYLEAEFRRENRKREAEHLKAQRG